MIDYVFSVLSAPVIFECALVDMLTYHKCDIVQQAPLFGAVAIIIDMFQGPPSAGCELKPSQAAYLQPARERAQGVSSPVVCCKALSSKA